MQILKKRVRGELVEIKLIRSWQDNEGLQIGLTPDGDYVTYDGKPVTDPRYFSVIYPSDERKRAEAWWRAREDKLAAEEKEAEKMAQEEKPDLRQEGPVYKPALEAGTAQPVISDVVTNLLMEMQRQQLEFQKSLCGMLKEALSGAGKESSTLQAAPQPALKALYSRQKGEGKNATAPKNWEEFDFAEKPEWWGEEEVRIQVGEDGATYTYTRYFVPLVEDQQDSEAGI